MTEFAYVTDTNALYWYLIGDKKLSAQALAVFRAAESGETVIVISAISLAELYYIHQKKPLPQDFATTYVSLRDKPYFQFAEFTPDEVLDFGRDQSVPEMHDRIIAGLARRIGAPLLTSDTEIKAARLVKVVW